MKEAKAGRETAPALGRISPAQSFGNSHRVLRQFGDLERCAHFPGLGFNSEAQSPQTGRGFLRWILR
jgi:hypothetical protein